MVAWLQGGCASCSKSLLGPLGTPRVLERPQHCLVPEAICARLASMRVAAPVSLGFARVAECVPMHVLLLGGCPSSLAMTSLSLTYMFPGLGLLLAPAPNS